jgi:uncharacterized membrane protein
MVRGCRASSEPGATEPVESRPGVPSSPPLRPSADDPPLHPRVRRVLAFLFPVGIYLLYLFVLRASMPRDEFTVLFGLITAYFFPPAGKESVIPLGIYLGQPWWLMAFSCSLLDCVSSLFVLWNLDLLLAVPYAGPRLSRALANGERLLAGRPWIRRFYAAGLVGFVMVPLQGSGGVTGTLIGRLLGLDPVTVIACVAAGSVISSTAIALGAEYLLLLTGRTGLLAAAALLLAAAILLFLWRWQRDRARDPRP